MASASDFASPRRSAARRSWTSSRCSPARRI